MLGICKNLKLILLVVAFAISFLLPSYSKAAQISGLRIGQGADGVRLVFDAGAKFNYNVFTLTAPKRLVIDTQNIDISPEILNNLPENPYVNNVRAGITVDSGVRIVFDLSRPVVIKKTFMLAPQSNFKWRLAIDLQEVNESEFLSKVGISHAKNSGAYVSKSASSSKNKPVNNSKDKSRKRIIVIDAGHGGIDPGAIGYSGTYEKNITLSMAKELKAILDKKGKYKVYLTRSYDIFIPLRERVNISRRHNADLFISIHADSAKNRKATGLSVYTLSEAASDKEAAALAEKENKADIIAGINFADHSKDVNDILLSMAQRETNNYSAEFATLLSTRMSKIVKTVSNTHRFAGFAVLKAPDVPSVLLELGYLSNKYEEKQLKQKSYRQKLAVAASIAIDKYFEDSKH